MTDDPNLVEILVGGMSYRGWTDVTVTAALDEAARSFALSITEKSSDDGPGDFMAWPIKPGDEVQVKLGGELVVTGYVDVWRVSYSFTAHGVSVDGRSKTGDGVDSSVDEGGGEFAKVRLDALAKKLFGASGVEVEVLDDVGKPFDVVRIQPGETAFETVDRLARMRGMTLTDTADGKLVLRKDGGGNGGAVTTLVEGQDILTGGSTFRADQKYSDVKVTAQRPRPGDDDSAGDYWNEATATAKDETVKRKRTLVIQAEEPGDDEDTQDRADREVQKRKAESIEAEISVQGFFYEPGKLWKPGDKVHVTSPMLRLDKEVVIKSVTWKQSFTGGSTTDLTLTIPEALGGKSKDAKSGKTPSKGGKGGKAFPVSDYWSDQA